ncbi:MAG: YidC/Oxa1 family membrane protein insertase [Oscillospiraceae bacterium]|jgi:YidC/Oxa1 family membrane protein insertase|nr:YidC/Oxa1 family membrane protein insertase [Oscillospiraceae bacterium]
MNQIYSVLGLALGWIMKLFYDWTGNYGVSILLFALIMQFVMIPMVVRQRKSNAKNMAIQPQMNELQKKYAKNREKLVEEQQKLYDETGHKMSMGCSTMLIQFVIMFGLMDVVYKPLTHILKVPADLINSAVSKAIELGVDPAMKAGLLQNEVHLIPLIRQGLEQITAVFGEWAPKIASLNTNILGFDATVTPALSPINKYTFIPVLSAVTALAMSLFSEYVRRRSAPKGSAVGGGGTMIMMFLLGPVMSLWIGFGFPAGINIYWIIRNIFSLMQEVVLELVMPQKVLVEKATAQMKENQAKARGKARQVRKKPDVKENLEDYEEFLSVKEANRRKLAEARKRAAEKYGEEYVEADDDDLD